MNTERRENILHFGTKSIIGCWRIVPIYTTRSDEKEAQREILKNIQFVQDRRRFAFSIANPLFTIRYEVEYMSATLEQVLILTLSAHVETYDAVQQHGDNAILELTLQQLPQLVPIKDITIRLQDKIYELILDNEAAAKERTEAAVRAARESRRKSLRESLRVNLLDFVFNKEFSVIDKIAIESSTHDHDGTAIHSHWQRFSKRGNHEITEQKLKEDPRHSFYNLFVVESAPHHHSKYLSPKDMDYCEWQSGDAGISYPTRTLSTIEFQEIRPRLRPLYYSQNTKNGLMQHISNRSLYEELMDEQFRKGLTVGYVHIINFGSLSSSGSHCHPHVQKKVDRGSLPLIATVWNSQPNVSSPSSFDPFQTSMENNGQPITYAITIHELFSHKLRCLWKMKGLKNKVQCLASKLVTIRTNGSLPLKNKRNTGTNDMQRDHQGTAMKKECYLVVILGFENGEIGTIDVPTSSGSAFPSQISKDGSNKNTIELDIDTNVESFLIKPMTSCTFVRPKIHSKEISSIRVEGDKVYVTSFDKSFSILQININLNNNGVDQSNNSLHSNSPNQSPALKGNSSPPRKESNSQQNPSSPTSKTNKKSTSSIISLVLVDHPLAQDHFTNNMVHHDVILSIAPFPSSSSMMSSSHHNFRQTPSVELHNLYQPNEWDQLFTSSWDTKIRYWKRELAAVKGSTISHSSSSKDSAPTGVLTKWISFALPPEHSKRVGCLAIYDFSSRSRQFTHHVGGKGVWSRVLVSGSMDTTAIVWDVSNPMRPMKVRHLQGHQREVVDVKILPHDNDHMPMVVTASSDKTIRCWDMISGQVFRLLPHDQDLFHGSFDILRLDRSNKPSGDVLVSVTHHGHALAVWNFLANHRQTRQFTDPVSCLAILNEDDIETHQNHVEHIEIDEYDERVNDDRENKQSTIPRNSRLTNGGADGRFINQHVPTIIGTYLGQSIISVKGKIRQVLDDSNTIMRALPSSPIISSLRKNSDPIEFIPSQEEVPITKNKVRRVEFSEAVATTSIDDVMSLRDDKERDSVTTAMNESPPSILFPTPTVDIFTTAFSPPPGVSTAAVRVSSIASFRYRENNNIDCISDFIIVGLLNGMISIWKRDEHGDQEYKKHCYFQDNGKGVFAVAVYDPIRGIAHLDPDEDSSEPLILVGGIADCPHSWSFNTLINNHGLIVNTAPAVRPIRGITEDVENEFQSTPKSSFKTGTIRSLLIHYLPHACMPTIFITGDFQSKTVIWKLKDLTPLLILEGLHQTDSVFALSTYDPTATWHLLDEAQNESLSSAHEDVQQLHSTLLTSTTLPSVNVSSTVSSSIFPFGRCCSSSDDIQNISIGGKLFSLKSTLFVISGGYDGNIGLWPIDLAVLRTLDENNSLSGISRVWSSDGSNKGSSQKALHSRINRAKSGWETVSKTTLHAQMNHDNQESVTSMTVYVPEQQTKQGIFSFSASPLIITGSIDHLIYVWNLYSQQKIHVLTGHSGRITSLLIYTATLGENDEQDVSHPMLVSGSDDCCTTYWEDGLQHHRYPPSRSVLLRTFYKDVEFHHQNHCEFDTICKSDTDFAGLKGGGINKSKQMWKQMKLLRSMYSTTNFLMEFPHIFYLALIERQETFFIEFLEDLQAVLIRIPPYKRNHSVFNHERVDNGLYFQRDRVDILEYAMATNSLVALRALLISWQRVLNQDIDDSLSQKLLLAPRMFSSDNLVTLAKDFPVEYADFICSLRLVKLHSTAESVDGKFYQTLPTGSRQKIIGSNHFLTEGSTLISGSTFLTGGIRIVGWLQNAMMSLLTSATSQQGFILPGKSQLVTSFLLPIKGFADIQQFSSVMTTCDLLNNRLDLFESPIVTVALSHYWSVHGWKVYFLHVLQYLFTLAFFVFCIYSFQYANETSKITFKNDTLTNTDSEEPFLALTNARRAHFAFLILMGLYGIDEICKLVGISKLKQQFSGLSNKFSVGHYLSLLSQLIGAQYVGQLWNTLNIIVISTAFFGTLIRYDLLLHYEKYNESKRSKRDKVSSCILAITAVALWFKILYFLRPIKTAGQFVAMVCTIINDIKYFLFVLVCVLTGFSQGFWLLLSNSSAMSNSSSTSAFENIRMAYFNTFMFMFGEINTDDLEGSKSLAFTRFFLVAFMLTMMILMLNLLIALMGDSFARTKENIEKIYWKELSSLMIDQSMPTLLVSILGSLRLLHYEKDEFIHVVRYTSDLRTDSSKQGKVSSALERSFALCQQQDGGYFGKLGTVDASSKTGEIIDRYENGSVSGIKRDFWL